MNFHELFQQKGISLERFLALVAVHDAGGSIAAAAPDDTNRQTLYCRQIKQLEKFFHTELKSKSGKSFRLTREGQKLAKIAREHFMALDDFRQEVDGIPMDVSIGAGDSLLRWLLLPRIPAMRKALPGSILEFHDLKNLTICQHLQDSVIDFGLLRSDLVTRGTLNGKALGKFGYSVFVPTRLRAPGKHHTEASLLQELPLAVQGGDTLFQERFEEMAASRNWKLNIQLRCQSFPQVSQALEAGELATVLPDLARLTMPENSVWVHPLASMSELRREIHLSWLPSRVETHPRLEKAIEGLYRVLKFSARDAG